MQNKLFLLLFITVFSLGTGAIAQPVEVSGKVSDSQTNDPLPGVNVVIEGTQQGTVTNADGMYEISVPSDQATLIFSYIGFNSESVGIAGRKVINVQLIPKLEKLEDLVVVAYGIARKEAATGSVNMIRAEEIENAMVTSPEKALQGKVAGVQINNFSGQPGGTTEIYIRGISSINSGNQPLYIVDGVPVISGNYGYSVNNSNVMASLDPSDIESITVLKDAAAASVYGSRAANGVVLITTKSGAKGETRFELNSKFGFSVLAKSGDYRFMTPEELIGYHRDAVRNAGFNPDNPLDPQHYYPELLLDGPQTDWFEEVFRKAYVKKIDLSASGGSEKTSFYLSTGYYDEKGIMIGSSMEKINLTINVDHKATDRISFGTKIKGSYTKTSDLPLQLYWASPIYGAQNLLPWENVRDEDGNINWEVPSNWNYNPVGIAEVNDQWDKFYRMMGSLYVEVDIIKGLKFKTNNSVDYLDGEGRNYWSPLMPDGKDINGAVWSGLTKNQTLQTSNTLTYNNVFNEKHRFRLLAGQEAQYSGYSLYDTDAQGVGTQIPYVSNTTKDLKDIDLTLSDYSLVSFFGILDYSYKNTYILSASIRSDGCSRFSPDNRFGTFWSVGASWNLHNESFMNDFSSVKHLKLRASYGTVGNFNIGNYSFYGTYATNEYNVNPTSYPSNLSNDDLTWEVNNEFNMGLDMVLIDRLNVNLDFYNRITSDMLLYVELPGTTGFTSQLRNTGKLSNTGVELHLDYDIIKAQNLNINLGFNLARNKTKLLYLGGEDQILDSWNKVHRLNESFSQWYVWDWAGVNPLTGMGMWYDADGNLTEKYENAARVTAGQVEPKFIGGITFNASWKGLSLDALFEFKTGHSVYVMESTYSKSDGWYIGHNQVASQLNYWKKPGDIAANPKPIANNTSNSNSWKSSRWIEKGDYLRFKQVRLNYSLPKNLVSFVKLNSVDVYTEASNVYAWHDVSYWDPERSYDGDIYSTYPLPRQLVFGVRIGF